MIARALAALAWPTPDEDSVDGVPLLPGPSQSPSLSKVPFSLQQQQQQHQGGWRHLARRRWTWIALILLAWLPALWTLRHQLRPHLELTPSLNAAVSALGKTPKAPAWAPIYALRPEQFGPPLSELGREADEVYDLGSTLRAEEYKAELEDFVRQWMAPEDADEQDEHSIISLMRTYFPQKGQEEGQNEEVERESAKDPRRRIPHHLFQTAPSHKALRKTADQIQTWHNNQPHWRYNFSDNEAASAWVAERFARPTSSNYESDYLHGGLPGLWEKMATPAVLRSDFWRYLVLATCGGVYSDTDTISLKPFEVWGRPFGTIPKDYTEPSLIVGVEADVGNRHDWHEWYPRPLQLSQWTIASAPGHPVLLDTLRRVVQRELALEREGTAEGETTRKGYSVMERTGPGPFTDSVLRYVRAKWGLSWASLQHLSEHGWRAAAQGDTKVLSITGFSPGVGHMGAEDEDHRAAMVKHAFLGRWRGQEHIDG